MHQTRSINWPLCVECSISKSHRSV
jgi:hypothetical protein